ncbi:ParB N-terminal domain-containing protein [Akkermansiaceae bacterium]|nr:ParB N-terminal domain-containing protein [Akkermansiaceae bacterium]
MLPINEVKLNDNNPRFIKDLKYKKLVQSIKESSQFMMLRELVLDENNMIIGGNMRLRACIELRWKKVPTKTFTRVMADKMNDEALAEGRLPKTYEEYCAEFLIKDNLSYGEWDYDQLAVDYNPISLDNMGMDLNPALFKDKDDTDDDTIDGVTNEKFNDYTVYFSNEDELEIWYGFLKKLKNNFKEHENISQRVLSYIAEVYEDNKISDSKRILKFIEYDVNGN